MRLLILSAAIVLLTSITANAEKKVREPLKWTELKLAACDLLVKNYDGFIDLDSCKKMNNFVTEKQYIKINAQKVVVGLGIELEDEYINCQLFASRKPVMKGKKKWGLSEWSVEEDLRQREQACDMRL